MQSRSSQRIDRKVTIESLKGIFKIENGVPTGIRTPVTAVKGRCPRPLDDRDLLRQHKLKFGGAKQDRTADLYNAIVALYQLSYDPSLCERNIRVNALTRQ